MSHWKFRLRCVDGGWGWGETGARAEMCAPGVDRKAAENFIRLNIPGGWRAEFVGETEDDFYLRNLRPGDRWSAA